MLTNHHRRTTTFAQVAPGAPFWYRPTGPGCGAGNYYTKCKYPTMLYNADQSVTWNAHWIEADAVVEELVLKENHV
jgi:hypothetical protein